jgi:uncharacterized membrane protein YhaH (DUF805 family)
MTEQFIELVKSSTKWSGRFNRQQFATVYFGMFLIGIVAVFLMAVAPVSVEPDGFMDLLLAMLFLAWYAVFIIVGVGAEIRRFHDLDLSGWHILLLIIPVVNFLIFLYLVFGPGKEVGETRWG